MDSEDSGIGGYLLSSGRPLKQSLPETRWYAGSGAETSALGLERPPRTGYSRETTENVVASVVDVASIFFAYRLGIEHFGTAAALAYAFFDAYLVIWQRKRFTNWIHKLFRTIT